MFQRHLWRHAGNQKYKTTINTCGLSFTMFLPSFVSFGIFHNHLCVSNERCGRKNTHFWPSWLVVVAAAHFLPVSFCLLFIGFPLFRMSSYRVSNSVWSSKQTKNSRYQKWEGNPRHSSLWRNFPLALFLVIYVRFILLIQKWIIRIKRYFIFLWLIGLTSASLKSTHTSTNEPALHGLNLF